MSKKKTATQLLNTYAWSNKINMYYIFRKPKTTLQNAWLNGGGRGGDTKTKPLTIAAASTTTKTKLRKTTKAIITFIAAYFEDSNIHGLQYVVKGGLTTIEK